MNKETPNANGVKCGKETLPGKRRLNFATLITKERLNFLAANRYPVDSITHVNFMAEKLSAD